MTLEFVKKELDDVRRAGLMRMPGTLSSAQGRLITINNNELLNFSSNNYLSLSSDPRIIEAAKEALDLYGAGSGASRLITGTFKPHKELEARIASFKGVHKAILFNSGYHANIGAIPALVGRGDEIFADRLNHASLIDGARLSRAKHKRYPHRDMAALEKLLKEAGDKRKLIITDALFSMEGTIAPLADIIELSNKYKALLYIDDAHGVGVLGVNGRGTLEELGLRTAENIIEMGTFGKAFGTFGAFVAADDQIIDLLAQKARSFIYTTSLPPFIASATIKAIDIVESEPERRVKLKSNVRRLRESLTSVLLEGSADHIVPIVIGEAGRAAKLSKGLKDSGYFVQAIRPPTVPRGRSMLRITAMSDHTDVDIDGLVEAILKNIDAK